MIDKTISHYRMLEKLGGWMREAERPPLVIPDTGIREICALDSETP